LRGAQAVANILKAEGVEYLFCFPNNHVIEAASEVNIKPLMARTERVTIGMADGSSRASNGADCLLPAPATARASSAAITRR
jgi:thiamine pyrophosphate-dependent acetolactate synthase large subunit-like protein